MLVAIKVGGGEEEEEETQVLGTCLQHFDLHLSSELGSNSFRMTAEEPRLREGRLPAQGHTASQLPRLELPFKSNHLAPEPSLGSVSPIAQLCPTLCDPMDCSMPGFPVHHQLLELAQTHVH